MTPLPMRIFKLLFMKKIYYLIAVACFWSGSSFAQNTFPEIGVVGIGTNSPGSEGKLIVLGSGLLANFTNGADQDILFKVSTPGASDKTSLVATSQPTSLALGVGNIEKVRIKNNGFVGLGTTDPQAFFDIGYTGSSGQLSAILARLPEGNGSGAGTSLNVRTYDSQPTDVVSNIENVKSFAIEHSFYSLTNSAINFYRGHGGTGGSIGFSTNNNNEQMRIMSSGNVGIGTSQPDSKLSVNGTIHSKEVKVDLSVPGPDYVFDKRYPLRSLASIEAFVSTYKHLPEIPSAVQMEKNGIDLSEMNMLLLKKVEELTLHLIEQEKKIERMSKRLNHQTRAQK